MMLFNKKEVQEAIEVCKTYCDNHATINLINSDGLSGISLATHDTSAIRTLVDAWINVYSYIDVLEKSDFSKEASSMHYYNELKQSLDILKMYNETIDHYASLMAEMLKYIADNKDCPLENEDFGFNCEDRCSNSQAVLIDCWLHYFEKKVRENEEKHEIEKRHQPR